MAELFRLVVVYPEPCYFFWIEVDVWKLWVDMTAWLRCVYWIPSASNHLQAQVKAGSLSMVHHGASCRGFHEKSWEWVQSVSGRCGFSGFRSYPTSCYKLMPAASNRMFEYHSGKTESLAIAYTIIYIYNYLYYIHINDYQCTTYIVEYKYIYIYTHGNR